MEGKEELLSGKISFSELQNFLSGIKFYSDIISRGFVLKRASHDRFCLQYETKDYFVARDKVRHFESEGLYAEMNLKQRDQSDMSYYINYAPPFVVSIYFPFVEKVAEKQTSTSSILDSLFKKEEKKEELPDISPVFFDHIGL